MTIHSKLMSLKDIVELDAAPASKPWRFRVPIYQRLYVWEDAQVQILLDDLINAWGRSEKEYFLGGVLLMRQGESESDAYTNLELIDGQQRFTTLWLMAQCWGHALQPFVALSGEGPAVPRLDFEIRDSTNDYLRRLLAGSQPIVSENLDDNLGKALRRIKNALEKSPNNEDGRPATVEDVACFIYRNVKLVVTTVPSDTDLNKLFEVINNRGVQLQHHEILKARLLSSLMDEERGAYATMWDACADMDSYIERSFAVASNTKAHEVCALFEQGKLHDGKQIADLLHHKTDHQHLTYSLEDALRPDDEAATVAEVDRGPVYEATAIRSIIGFPLFLQHVLRVWLHLSGRQDLPRLLDKNLLKLFEESALKTNADDVRSFLQMVFRLRVLFDQHVIKWVDRGESDVHLLTTAKPNDRTDSKRYLNRSLDTDSHRALSMLQSMLYHSQELTTQYWLTPLLLHLHNLSGKTESAALSEHAFRWLQHLDNHMFGSDEDDLLIHRSRAFMDEPWRTRKLVHQQELRLAQSTNFKHYWFYKTEFVLWHQKLVGSALWRDFLFTAKNSVEHVSPQNPKPTDRNKVYEKQELDGFGNLALVSRGINSEYGNLPFDEKRTKFGNKRAAHNLESLKLDRIYSSESWGDDAAKAHKEQMIGYIEEYCELVSERSRREY